ncbi:MAG: hypothetical protein MJY69_07565 [Bacteroidales bacterium]|nr:hypothetical protein [Bacteroidales bacterium]
MEYFFDDWKKALQDLNDSIEKSVDEVRSCKDAIRMLQIDNVNKAHGGNYLRDSERIVLSAPEIVIGNVDKGGYLLPGQPSRIIIRGQGISLEGSGPAGYIVNRAPGIRSYGVDPGPDGRENVVSDISEVISQARGISLNSSGGEGVFTSPPAVGEGLHLHSDSGLFVEAADSAERKKKYIDKRLDNLKKSKDSCKKASGDSKKEFESAIKELTKVLDDSNALSSDIDDLRSSVGVLDDLHDQLETAMKKASNAFYMYSSQLADLAETCRKIKCLEDAKGKIPSSQDFKNKITGAGVWISGEKIGLSAVDGDGNIRENPGSGVRILSNSVSVGACGYDGALLKKGRISLNAMDIDLSTANTKFKDQKKRDSADILAEGNVHVVSKKVKLESVDSELKDGKTTEKALTKDGSLKIRFETTELSATDTEGKAAGIIDMNAKEVEIKSTDVKKDNRSDDKLAAGGTLLITAEKIYAGSRDKNNKTKQLQLSADKTGVFGDTTAEMQQGEAKAVVQLDGGNLSVSGSKTELYGDTTVNGKTDFKADIKAPKATIDNVEAKSSFKSTNISDGIAVPGAPSSAKLSAKLKVEEKKAKEKKAEEKK